MATLMTCFTTCANHSITSISWRELKRHSLKFEEDVQYIAVQSPTYHLSYQANLKHLFEILDYDVRI